MITNKRFLSTSLAAACCFALLHGAQAQTDYEVPRTEWDQPDLQGVWNFSSNTPMQRPTRYGTQEFLTAEQIEEAVERQARTAAAAEAAAAQRVVDPEAPPVGDDPGGYNDFWFEVAGLGDTVRTSHIVYPEDRGLSERCIVGFNSGPPFVPSLYNNNMQIVQNRDTAVIFTEMIHDARIVPLIDAPALDDDIRLWSGDSRGWWEGDSLVVQTRNFNGYRQTFSSTGTNYDMMLTERFTRTAYDTVNYEFTIDDPATFTDKITAIVPMTKVAGQIYEYACHEGNYGMVNILRGERMAEQRAGDDS